MGDRRSAVEYVPLEKTKSLTDNENSFQFLQANELATVDADQLRQRREYCNLADVREKVEDIPRQKVHKRTGQMYRVNVTEVIVDADLRTKRE